MQQAMTRRHSAGAATRADTFLTFLLAAEEYAVDIGAVQEIGVMLPVTPIPDAPTGVVGVISLRGTVIPVLDMRARLGLPPAPTQSRDAVIVVARHGELRVGLVVDRVLDVAQIAIDRIEPPPAFG